MKKLHRKITGFGPGNLSTLNAELDHIWSWINRVEVETSAPKDREGYEGEEKIVVISGETRLYKKIQGSWVYLTFGSSGAAGTHATTHESGGSDEVSHDQLADFDQDEHFTMLDEDDMSTDSASHAATQQSIKAYVDNNIFTCIIGGERVMAVNLMENLVDDTTPQLGGDLDLNGKNIDFPTTANISDCLDEDDMASDSATALATQQSIKAYVDASAGTDDDAIHDNVGSEISAIANKAAPVDGDYLIIEDSEDSNNKKHITWSQLPSAGSVDTSGTPEDDDWARFTDADTIEGLSDAELLAAISGDAASAFDWNNQNLTGINSLFLDEQAEADADVAGDGQIWVKSDTPNSLYYTDDAGTDVEIVAAGALTAHKDRHDPEDGGDALDCAAASEIAGVQAAGEGSAHTFARSDHAHQIQHGIADNHIVTIDSADVADDEYARFTADGLEGRSASEVRSDINVEDGADVTDATNVDAAGAVMESDYNAHTVLAATADNTPAALSVTEQTLVGRLTGGNIAAVAIGISDNNIVQIDDADAADNDYCKLTANGIEGRSYSELRTDINVADGADVTADNTCDTPGGAGTDTTAIHDDTAGEINAVAAKASPHSDDMILIEDSEDSNAKKKITVGDLPTGSGITSFDVGADSGADQEVTDGEVVTFIGGTGINTTVGTDGGTDVTIDVDVGIADDKILQVDDADAADDDYAKFTAAGIEGRSYSEVRTDLNVADGADVTADNAPQAHKDSHDPEDGGDALDCAAAAEISTVVAAGEGSAHSFARSDHVHAINHSIADNHIVTMDDADAADDDYAKFTANGLEGRSYTEVRTDLNVADGADVTADNAPQAHKDSHDPEDGGDALDCAAAAEISTVVAAGEGSAHSFARSDHVHAINHSIADNHIVTMDDADAADDDYAKFTANGLEGRSAAEAKTDLGFITDLVDDTSPQLGGNLDLNENDIAGKRTPSSDHTSSALKLLSFTNGSGDTINCGDACYIKSDGEVALADADADTTMPAVVMCVTNSTANAGTFSGVMWGSVRDDSWNWTPGGLIYISTTGTTGNTLTQTAPSGSGDQVQIVGVALTADVIFFNPNLMLIEIA